MKAALLLFLATAGCLVDVDEWAGGNPVGGLCAGDEQCDRGLICGGERCALAPSCAELLRRRASTPSGRYQLQLDATGSAPARSAFCDMKTLGGGWMLVEASSVWKRTQRLVTAVEETDGNGGLVATFYANARGCGEENAFQTFHVEPSFAWKELRFRQTFAGKSVCYSILGAERHIFRDPPRLIPFDRAVDTVLAEVKMGYEGDAYDGENEACTNSARHFWNRPDPLPREIAVVLRRRDAVDPGAGPGTGVSCTEFGPGTMSPTWWRYSDIYVR